MVESAALSWATDLIELWKDNSSASKIEVLRELLESAGAGGGQGCAGTRDRAMAAMEDIGGFQKLFHDNRKIIP